MAETLTLEGVLARVHLVHADTFRSAPLVDCLCGKGGMLTITEHSAHVAAHLADAVRAWLLRQREAVWEAVVDIRDGSPRLPTDADSGEIADAVLGALTEADQ